MIYMIQFSANMGVHSRYIAALERRINELCKNNVALWESKVVLSCLFHPCASFSWAMVTMMTLAIGLLLIASWFTSQQISRGWSVLLSSEVIVLIGLWAWQQFFDHHRAEKHIEWAFRQSVIQAHQSCTTPDDPKQKGRRPSA